MAKPAGFACAQKAELFVLDLMTETKIAFNSADIKKDWAAV
jgi:hypothetical protein